MFYTIEIVDRLLDANYDLLLYLFGPSARVGHIDTDIVDWDSGEYFLTHILGAE